MTKTGSIEHLLKLLDDESTIVRGKIINELKSHVHELEEDWLESHQLSPRQKKYLEPLLLEKRQDRLRKDWSLWFTESDPYKKLEIVLDLISQFQNVNPNTERLG